MSRLLRMVFCLIFVSQFIFGANMGDVVINEIAWMGTAASTYDEWIELYNTTGNVIDLTGWSLNATDGEPTISLSGMILAHQHFLLERSDDNTVSNIAADQFYSGALGNSGEILELRDASNNLIDEVDSWYGGDNDTKSSMERISPHVSGTQSSNWGTNDGITKNGLDAGSNPLNATPKAQNSVSESSLAVSLSGFSAEVADEHVVLNWITESEVNSVGFNIYRSISKEGPFEKVNLDIILSKGNSSTRETYQYVDSHGNAENGYWYKLAEVDQNGVETFYGLIYVPCQEIDVMPKKTGLLPNYPNPFNPSTAIVFEIGEEESHSSIFIDIINIRGESICEIFSGILNPGCYTRFWDGRQKDGFSVPSGIYFCRIRIDHQMVDVRKMMKIE